MRRLTAVWPILLALCLAAYSGCCRQGYVLHGDWSLGLVRPAPAGSQCAAECGACTEPNCPGPNSPGQRGCPSGNACEPSGASGNRCAIANRGAGGKRCVRGSRAANGAQVAAVPGPTGPDQGHPRFHPVPVVAPAVDEPLLPEPEELPEPEPAPLPNSARRRPATRPAYAPTTRNYSSLQRSQ